MNLNIIPVKWSDEGVLMLDQRLLPTEEKWLTLQDLQRGCRRHQGHGRSRRAGDRRFGGVRHCARGEEVRRHERRRPRGRDRIMSATFWQDASDGRQSFLGDRPDEADVSKGEGRREVGQRDQSRSCSTMPKRSTKKISSRSG